MHAPFPDRQLELSLPPADSQLWKVAQGSHDGDPLILRFNTTAQEIAGHPTLPIKLGFGVPLNHPDEGGLANAEENAQLGAIEDLIAERVLEAAVGVHVMTLTSGVMKEFVFYIAPGPDIAALHAALRAEIPSHDLQCLAEEEPDWSSFRYFVPQ